MTEHKPTPKQISHKCDFCKSVALYDGKTKMGPWAFMCREHFDRYHCGLAGTYSILNELLITTKVCVLCNREKPVGDFYKYTDHSGITRYRNDCKECNLAEKKRASFRK